MGLPADLAFRTKGRLAIDILTEAFADGVRLDFVCGDEVYGSCTELREYCEDHDQAYVLRVPCSFRAAAARRGHADLQAGRRPAGPPRLGGPLSRDRIERTTLVRLGVAGHRLAPASPADPPPPAER